MKRRAVLCIYLREPLEVPPVEFPRLESRALQKWPNLWTTPSGRTVWVRALFHDVHRRPELLDAREWIESIHDAERWPAGTVFEVVVEEPATA